MQPLSTPESISRSPCPPAVAEVRLFGFQEKDPNLAERLTALFGSTATVEHDRLDAFFDADHAPSLDLALIDTYRHVKSNASARRYTNMYFTFTIIDIWILPILHSTNLFVSTTDLSAEIGVRDADSGGATRRSTLRAVIREKPTGYFGPSDGEFTSAMIDRATTNLAVAIHDEVCSRLDQAKLRME